MRASLLPLALVLAGCEPKLISLLGDSGVGPADDSAVDSEVGPAVGRYAGAVVDWPVEVAIDDLDTARLPLVSVLLARDDDGPWSPVYEVCYSEQGYTDPVRISDGVVRILETSCTRWAGAWRVTIQETEHHQGGPITNGEATVYDADFDPAAPPLMRVYWRDSRDDVWVSRDQRCNGEHTVVMTPGVLALRDTWCTPDEGAFQVAWTPATAAWSGIIGRAPVLRDPAFDPEAPPALSVLFSTDGGDTWFPNAQSTSEGYPTRMRQGELELVANHVTTDETLYRVTVGAP